MKNFKIATLSLCLLPLASMAQTNIKKAFSKLLKDPKVEVTEHYQQRNPNDSAKRAECEVYAFSIPKSAMQLLTDIENAFEKDSDKAYQTESGKRTEKNRAIQLAVGEESMVKKAIIAKDLGAKYYLACFLDPDDESATHRYAYAMEFQPADSTDLFSGKLVTTYATTQKFRQDSNTRASVLSRLQFKDGNLASTGFGNLNRAVTYSPPTWFETFTSYITAMTTADTTTRRALATKIYSHTKDLTEVDERDKDTARKLLNLMLNDRRYSDSVVAQLLSSALSNIN